MKKSEAGVTPDCAQTSSSRGLLRHREALLRRPAEDERLVAELVERGAELAGDDALPAVEPEGADPDLHGLGKIAGVPAGGRVV